MTDVAVVKADHLGDFILSLPALRKLSQKFGKFDFFAAPGNQFLQEYFLPDEVTFRPTRLAYLQKDDTGEGLTEFIASVRSYALVIFLRDDGFSLDACNILGKRSTMSHGSNSVHETRIQQNAVEPLTGAYSRTDLFWPSKKISWPERITCVGLSLSAGFFANKMPLITWWRLGQTLRDKRSIRLKLIGGPLEADELRMLGGLLHVGKADMIVGGPNLDEFYDGIGECDVVVGADSGTLHLVSAQVPVLGIFTSSPWQRFSPFGAHNRVLYSDVPCSPCIQFSKHAFNGCMSRECAALISPIDIEEALFAEPDVVPSALGPLVNLVFGPSHIT